MQCTIASRFELPQLFQRAGPAPVPVMAQCQSLTCSYASMVQRIDDSTCPQNQSHAVDSVCHGSMGRLESAISVSIA
jgi:hypothetical protein